MISRYDQSKRRSRAVIHNGTVYLSGQVASDESADISEQTRTTLDKIEKLLEEAGSSRAHILSATIFIKDMKDFSAMNAVYDDWVEPNEAPTRACVQASMARPEVLVEICIVAATID